MLIDILMLIFSVCILQLPLPLFPLATFCLPDKFMWGAIVVYELLVFGVSGAAFYYFQFIRYAT